MSHRVAILVVPLVYGDSSAEVADLKSGTVYRARAGLRIHDIGRLEDWGQVEGGHVGERQTFHDEHIVGFQIQMQQAMRVYVGEP